MKLFKKNGQLIVQARPSMFENIMKDRFGHWAPHPREPNTSVFMFDFPEKLTGTLKIDTGGLFNVDNITVYFNSGDYLELER